MKMNQTPVIRKLEILASGVSKELVVLELAYNQTVGRAITSGFVDSRYTRRYAPLTNLIREIHRVAHEKYGPDAELKIKTPITSEERERKRQQLKEKLKKLQGFYGS